MAAADAPSGFCRQDWLGLHCQLLQDNVWTCLTCGETFGDGSGIDATSAKLHELFEDHLTAQHEHALP
ncbi:unnamed protein product, partial [Scytosiphon promiscuus]